MTVLMRVSRRRLVSVRRRGWLVGMLVSVSSLVGMTVAVRVFLTVGMTAGGERRIRRWQP